MATDRATITRKKMVMIFLLDGSNSMNENHKMDALNKSMQNAIEIAQDIDAKNTEVQIEVAVMLFGTGSDGNQCKWLYGEPEPVDRFEWEDQVASGWTPMADAIRKANQAMSRSKFMDSPSGSMAPVVVMISDGIPCTSSGTMASDLADTDNAIAEISRNDWFKVAIKAAIAIGDDADKNILAKFTGDSKTVFDAHSSDRLKDVIEFIVLRSSMINSTIVSKGGSKNKPEDDEAQQRFAEASEEEKANNGDMNSTGWTV